MATNQGKISTKSKELESLISNAAKKVGARKENDICRYIPVSQGGYIHHFTMKKMKTEEPENLAKMITKHIINEKNPKKVTPRKRRPRGSRKRALATLFSREDIDRIVNMARLAGDLEMVRKLSPRKDLKTAKKELITSIKQGKVEQELWNSYIESVTAQEGGKEAFATASQSNKR